MLVAERSRATSPAALVKRLFLVAGLLLALAACPKKAASGSCAVAADCLAAETCLAGRCLPSACGDRPCHAGQACVAGACVDEGCAAVTCPAGQTCARGSCYPTDCAATACEQGEICWDGEACRTSLCLGVVCQSGATCADGRCLSTVCNGIVCGEGAACEDGRCVETRCIGVVCAEGSICADGRCLAQQCQGVPCPEGQGCLDGACVDARCVGVSCPAGAQCEQGACRAPAGLSIISPAEGARVGPYRVFSGLCTAGTAIEASYSAGASGPASVACPAGTFAFGVGLSGADGERTVALRQADSSGGAATASRTVHLTTGGLSLGVGFDEGASLLARDPLTGRLYVAGYFSRVGSAWQGGIARLMPDGTPDPTFACGAGFDSDVTALAVDPATGKVYVGGWFDTYDGVPVPYLVRLEPGGALDETLQTPAIDGAPLAILPAADGGVFIAGWFYEIAGQVMSYIARLTAQGALDPAFAVGEGFDGRPQALALAPAGDALYVAGDFSSYDAVPRLGIARLHLDGSLDAAFDPGTGFDSSPQALAVDASGVYVAGWFTTFGGVSRNGLARLLESGALDPAFDPGTGFDDAALSLALDSAGGVLYVGGGFQSYRGASSPWVAALNLDGTARAGFSPATERGARYANSNGCLGLLLDGGQLYCASVDLFAFAGERANGVVRLDAASGARDLGFLGGRGLDAPVKALARSAATGEVYVGGEFERLDGRAVGHLARLKADGTFDPLYPPHAGFDGLVRALAVDAQGRLLAVGAFASVGGVARAGIARLLPDGEVDASFDPGAGLGGTAYGLALDGEGRIYLGGEFVGYGGLARTRLVRVLDSGAPDPSFDAGAGPDGAVTALALDGAGNLYVGGSFANFAGSPSRRLARLTATGALDPTFQIGEGVGSATTQSLYVDGVSALLADEAGLFVGGRFATYDGRAVGNLVRLLPSGAPDPDFVSAPGLTGVTSSAVFALARDAAGRLLVVGDFNAYRGSEVHDLVRLDATGALDPTFAAGSGFSEYCRSLLLDGQGRVYCGGAQRAYNDAIVQFLVRLLPDGSIDPE